MAKRMMKPFGSYGSISLNTKKDINPHEDCKSDPPLKFPNFIIKIGVLSIYRVKLNLEKILFSILLKQRFVSIFTNFLSYLKIKEMTFSKFGK